MASIKISREELDPFLEKSNRSALRALAINWGLILGSLALAAWWLHPIPVILALIVLGSRQLSLGIMMHDCGHGAFFSSPKLNSWFGKWFCALPILANIEVYQKIHAKHHRIVGQPDDPDLPNYQAYPVTRASLGRKFFRDLTGQTGVKILLGTFKMGRDLFSASEASQKASTSRYLWGSLLFHSLFLGLLWLSGHPWLYLIWWAAYLTTYMFFARIRQIAEHGAVPELSSDDPLQNTRTTLARWWERMTVAPNYVNYHLEHHLFPSVPPYRLGAFHRYLKKTGHYEGVEISKGYLNVLHSVTAN